MNVVFPVNQALVALVWALVGAGGGWLARWGSVRLARMEELEPGSFRWQVIGPPILAALLFAVFAFELGPTVTLLVRSVYILILVQVIFFDLEHRLILDRVMFPSMVLAAILSLFNQPWWAGLASGFGAGVLFLLIALAGSWIFKAEAMGFGDIKLVIFIGLALGPLATVQAVFYGVFLAGLAAVVVIVWHRSTKGTLAYGPYLAVGTLIALFQLH